ncbi:hypothetical protein NCS55_00327000 [Fusarium keratoplasticum]|nr:hypothetical protein NCS55_00327000 [Fusarium keratoplasticum]
MASSCASGNQAKHASTQINGSVRHRHRTKTRIKNLYLSGVGANPTENPPASRPVTDNFNFGSIQTLEEDQDGHENSQLILRPSPIINKDDAEYISDIGTKIEKKYNLLCRRTERSKSAKKLGDKARLQRARIDLHVRTIKQWPRLTAKPQRDDLATLVPQDIMPDYGMSQRTAELRSRLREIHGKLDNAVDELARISKRNQSRMGTDRTRSSKVTKNSQVSNSSKSSKKAEVFKNLAELVDRIELDIAAIQSQLYQLSTCHSSPQSTKGFGTLFVSSSATRTLYRHLCLACPLTVQEQGHSHTALVGLVPEKEPRDIAANKVAITTHHVAIESAFRRGDYIWFEARSMLILPGDASEAVYSEPSSPQAVIEGLQRRLRRDSGYSSASASSHREPLQVPQERPGGNGSYCIKVCPGSLAQGGDGLAMCIGDDRERGCHEMLYLDEKRRPITGCAPLKLSDIIEEGEEGEGQCPPHPDLFKRSHKLKNDRYKMAFKIAEAALRYGWREWLGDAWGIQDIVFYPYVSKRMPFLRAEIFKHGCGKLEKFMFNLGFVLLQVGLWKQLPVRTPGHIFDRVLEDQLSRLGLDTTTEFQEAVRYCVEFSRYGDCHRDDNDFQQAFYQKVISPLRKMAKMPVTDKIETSGKLGHSTDTEMSS